jgi:hypothetical protein
MFKVSRNSVAGIVQREAVVIEQLKESLGRKATVLYAQLMERIADDLDNDEVMAKTSFKDKVVASNIINEQWRVDAGLPTQVHEHRRVDAEDVNDAFLDAIDVQATEQHRKTGFGGGVSQQKGLPGAAGSSGQGAGSSGQGSGSGAGEVVEGEFESESGEAVGDDKSPVDEPEREDSSGSEVGGV